MCFESWAFSKMFGSSTMRAFRSPFCLCELESSPRVCVNQAYFADPHRHTPTCNSGNVVNLPIFSRLAVLNAEKETCARSPTSPALQHLHRRRCSRFHEECGTGTGRDRSSASSADIESHGQRLISLVQELNGTPCRDIPFSW
jgi:hypothetical protein